FCFTIKLLNSLYGEPFMKKEHFEKVRQALDTFDEGYDYAYEYDSMLHDYNGFILYQAESQFIRKVGDEPGITITELSVFFDKTKSACSQLMYRMKKKNLLKQVRNEHNNREYNLYLTDKGQQLYQFHKIFEDGCYRRTAEMLSSFTMEELETYIKIQKKMNEAFLLDVNESKERNIR
ncbi:hypothetical protein, partial [Lactonifactor longoviformis]